MKLGFISNQITSAIIQGTSIVWFPVPKFDSPSIFAKLLDEDGGEFSIVVKKESQLKQYYEHPLVLTTEVNTEKGKIKITDLLPLGETVIIRKVESEVPFSVVFKPFFKYALYRPIILKDKFINSKGRDCVAFLYSWDGKVKREGPFVWKFSEGKGFLIANYSTDVEHGALSERGKNLRLNFEKPFEKTIEYWESFEVKSNMYEDLYKSSVFVLLGSIYSPSGASIAAPTTSLPEVVGGSRNWDYRFAWVRDSSITAEALINAGFIVEARRILNFLLSLINFTSKPFYYPLYTIEGTIPPPEVKLMWLSGYKNSKPVRIGNAASKQIQLDVEGFFLNALYKYFEKTGDKVYIKDVFDKVEYIADWVSENWLLKDSGIWEDRGEPRHYTHSKIMMWVALDRAGKLAEHIGKEDRWRESRESLRKWILEKCVTNGYFARFAGSEDVDSSILSAPLYGFVNERDILFLNTLSKIEKELKVGNFVKRYKTDFMGEAKHPFLLTTLWLARVYIRLGRIEEAKNIISNIEEIAGNLKLIGEHLDVEKKEFTGNFPQVFVHAEIINLIKELEEKESKGMISS
ncbi:alpha,alpha-trehalase TreH1 [Sulfurisphaera ohwakuensis]|uniref:GH15 family glucan-1,4-alpha-glucosidase n=1 Tax=Sulfurisphaera ohwakuensis TaxID=69656 RepID=A0A650CFJ9_SULOH|nr:alpha,alpha-trehalase TreH1 [Sulfurisphaera ohwakuensis]MBB5254974.1 GH15 family glucan-1,4-alpha-glucosidase [Sulfurisphaera ohwakuensis]QGR16633.1 glycoside hydrolase family 15 protein [Sulfurisphaera ohwakuensis]